MSVLETKHDEAIEAFFWSTTFWSTDIYVGMGLVTRR